MSGHYNSASEAGVGKVLFWMDSCQSSCPGVTTMPINTYFMDAPEHSRVYFGNFIYWLIYYPAPLTVEGESNSKNNRTGSSFNEHVKNRVINLYVRKTHYIWQMTLYTLSQQDNCYFFETKTR